jgi:DNA-binding response OmpR family regulator
MFSLFSRKHPLQERRALIAEDDRQMAAILQLLLEKTGWTVRCAYDGEEALRVIKTWKPHLLVLDIMLPVIDGFHVCQTMNDDHAYDPRPQVIITSGRGSDWDQNLGSACGAAWYLVKPFTNAEFVARVQQVMNPAGTAETGGNAKEHHPA